MFFVLLTQTNLAISASIVDGSSDLLYLVIGSFSSEVRAKENARKLGDKTNETVNVQLHDELYRLTIGPMPKLQVDEIRASLKHLGINSWLWRVQQSGAQATNSVTEKAPVIKVPVAEVGVTNVPAYSPLAAKVDTRQQKVAGEPPVGDSLSLLEAIHRGMEKNLQLLASAARIDAAAGETGEARGALLPQLGLNVSQAAIDEDRAEASNGRAPEYQTFASLSLQQLIYSDDVSAAYQIRKILEQAAGQEYEVSLQDTVLKVAVAYLTVLRADSLVAVFEDDLELTISNLDRANIRLSFGVANKSEVYRWQTRLATSNSNLVSVTARAATARVSLNQALNQPLDEEEPLQKPRLGDNTFLLNQTSLFETLQKPENHKPGFEFWQNIALSNAPELALVRSQLLVTERSLLAARRSLSIPTIALVGEYRKRITEGGAGVDELDFTIPGTGETIGGTTDDVEWNAALTADLALYAGGGRLARIQTANADVSEARLILDETQLSIRAQLLRQYYLMIASLKNIEHARVASEAGANNLELVVESYASGVVTIIDLLDAQLAALTSALDAANAEYDFLIEYFRLQRISGNFDVLMESDDRDRLRSDLQSILR